jgi:hypothetical protein
VTKPPIAALILRTIDTSTLRLAPLFVVATKNLAVDVLMVVVVETEEAGFSCIRLRPAKIIPKIVTRPSTDTKSWVFFFL